MKKESVKKTKRDTVGKISSDLLQKQPESRDPIELQRKMQEDYIDHLKQCIETHKKIFPADFYIVVITKNEKLMPNVFRNYFSARISCPTPEYDQSVFKYHAKDEYVEYIWTVPSKDACIHLKENAQYVVKEEQQLLKFVLHFLDGTLDNVAKHMNGESIDSILLATK
jgi:hypothetical protein